MRRLLLTAAIVLACEPQDVVVFQMNDAGTSSGGQSRVEAGAGGGPAMGTGGVASTGGTSASGGGPGFRRCRGSDECDSNFVCDKPDCNATDGRCVPRPLACDAADRSFTCGCDHVTYWNDCLRLQYGVAAGTPGECGSRSGGYARTCRFPPDCNLPGATCAVFFPPTSTCGSPPPPGGTCWVPPSSCPSGRVDDPPILQRCAGPYPSPPASCLDMCTALRSFAFYAPSGSACQ